MFEGGGGGDCLKNLKRVEQKRREGNKDFKSEDKLDQGVGALKRISWDPLTNYDPNNSEVIICRYYTKEVFLKTLLVSSCESRAIFQNQATKFGQLIEREKYFSSKIMLKMRLRC